MEFIILVFLIVILLLMIYVVFKGYYEKSNGSNEDIRAKIIGLSSEIARIESSVKNEFSTNRLENNDSFRTTRQELSASLKSFEQNIEKLTATMESQLKEFTLSNTTNSKETRKDLTDALTFFRSDFTKSISDFNSMQKDNFLSLLGKQESQNRDTIERLDKMRDTIERKVFELQTGNEKKLEEIRVTVDEKLQKTLETRLGESFKLVSERLEAVHKGLGDMQQLATGVGDLKRVLSNVKSRGILGEYQLENILEQILTIEQFAKNVKTKDGSNALVEFAVKLPGRGDDKDKVVWLPIDSKFPKEDFELLSDAYDKAVPELIDEYRRSFIKGIKKCAIDIASKYVDPPNTTDFAILFLPIESLYAEVLRTPGLFESLQREHKIIITGPTTLSALLNSLQMGFRTLAIERRSSEVWQLLGAVKTEFGNFAGILEKTQKKLQEASNVIDQAGVRSRAIERKLRTVQELPPDEARSLIESAIDNEINNGPEADEE